MEKKRPVRRRLKNSGETKVTTAKIKVIQTVRNDHMLVIFGKYTQ